MIVLLNYIQAAMRHARYEILPEDGAYYGEIAPYNGVYSRVQTLEGCREELQDVLGKWIPFRVSRHLSLPAIDGIEIKISEVA